MPSFILNNQVLFSCLYPTKNLFFITPRVFGCTCFVQDLFPDLDKLSPQSIKYVFIGFFELRKDTSATILTIRSILCLQVSRSLSLF